MSFSVQATAITVNHRVSASKSHSFRFLSLSTSLCDTFKDLDEEANLDGEDTKFLGIRNNGCALHQKCEISPAPQKEACACDFAALCCN